MAKPKKYHKNTLTGQKGINLIEKIVLDMGLVWHARTIDAGIDGMIEVRDNTTGDAYNFHILVQSKATENPFAADNGQTFEYTCDERDIDYWMKGNAPVILICSNTNTGEAYWMNIKDYFQDPKRRKARKVFFSKTKNKFVKEEKQSLLNLVSENVEGVYFTPVPKQEKIVSNLLPVTTFPDTIYSAKTRYRKRKEFWKALNELDDKKGINKSWILLDEKIYSFNNLNESPWKQFISGKIESFSTNKWSGSHDFSEKNHFIQLLGAAFDSHMYHQGVIHVSFDSINLFYFKPRLDPNNLPKSWRVQYNRFGRKSHQSVCEKYARKSDPSIISYYRHLAFETRFSRYDNKWYLEITPTYFFTHDGFKMHHYYEQKLKGKKALDRATAVFSETVFWSTIIGKKDGGLFGSTPIQFGTLLEGKLNVGIDDELWLKKEDESEEEISVTNDQLTIGI